MKKKLNLWFTLQLSVLAVSIIGAIAATLLGIYWVGVASLVGIVFVVTLFRVQGFDCLFEEEYSPEEVEQIKELMKSKGFTFQEAQTQCSTQHKSEEAKT